MGDNTDYEAQAEVVRTREARALAVDRSLNFLSGYTRSSADVLAFADDIYFYIEDGVLPDGEE